MKKRVKFYADTGVEENKLFTFYVNSRRDVSAAMKRFSKKFKRIRAAWYEDTGAGVNERIL
jgi:hypothetical protein